MHWDIFCKVIDNHGDVGVCWRLACQLAVRGQQVRLWIDDRSALQWMAPQGHQGVSVVDWSDPAAVDTAIEADVPDVLIEAFGCDPEPALIARFAEHAAAGHGGKWLNLEYLSAEPHVERLHLLPSSVFHGPGAGLTKHFFYPGFTPATGGLLREPDLAARQATFNRSAWLAAQGISWRGERMISLFCYEPDALGPLLKQWAEGSEPTLLLVTSGRAAKAVAAELETLTAPQNRIGMLSIVYLPLLPHPAFDDLLRACDLNFVRGEDSLVRALWAGPPFVWQIYPQDDGAHHDKLDAFLDAIGAPPTLRAFHQVWNGATTATALVAPDAATLQSWTEATSKARTDLLAQDDLVTQLMRFVSLLPDA
jgi:uncharacterized repeat protein (TIGR03837 family)